MHYIATDDFFKVKAVYSISIYCYMYEVPLVQ
jgi:hypothetical protein